MANGKIALITGANKGLGFEIARQLIQAGCTVLLGSRNTDRGMEAADKLKHLGDVRSINLDLDRPETIDRAAKTINAEFGRLDILVNNAGIGDPADGLPRKQILMRSIASSPPTSSVHCESHKRCYLWSSSRLTVVS